MTKKRPDKVKMEVVAPPTSLNFTDFVSRGDSTYVSKLLEAFNKGLCVRINFNDKYMLQQFKAASKKASLRLLFSRDGDDLYIKPMQASEEEKKLLLFLREPRSMNELLARKYELHLSNTLSKFAADGLAHVHKEKWVLTAKGLDAL